MSKTHKGRTASEKIAKQEIEFQEQRDWQLIELQSKISISIEFTNERDPLTRRSLGYNSKI
jgi:hypothetical protein